MSAIVDTTPKTKSRNIPDPRGVGHLARLRRAGTILAVLLLAGCMDTATATAPNAVPPTVANAGPGPEMVDGLTALMLFQNVCLDTLPRFAGAEAAMARMPIQRNPRNGLYFHRNLDLSFKLQAGQGGYCSMVFASDESPSGLAIVLVGGAGGGAMDLDPATGQARSRLRGGSEISFRQATRAGNRTYYNVVVTAGR